MSTRRRALVRRPSRRLDEGLVTHIERSSVDVALATRQWERTLDAMAGAGWELIEVPPADDCPDAVFIEDTVVMFDDLAVLCRPGAAERRPEVSAVAGALTALGYPTAPIEPPATLDGGDVLKVKPSGLVGDGPSTVYVGVGRRTNDAAVDQLGTLLKPRGWQVVGVPTTKVLHLKSAVTALPDGTVIGYEPVVDDPSVFDRFLAVPEEAGAHVVLLGDNLLLMSSGAPETAAMLTERGYEPVTVDIGELEKLEGCVTCLSIRLRRAPTG